MTDEDTSLLARTARAVAAAEQAGGALGAVLSAVRSALGASGAALLRVDRGRLVPVASDGLDASERPMDEADFPPEHGGAFPLVLGGRVEGVLLVGDVPPQRLAGAERTLAALLDLAAVTLRNARLTEERRQEQRESELQALERISDRPGSPVTARAFGGGPLSATQRERFRELVDRYAVLLDLALEQRAYVVDHRIPDRLRELADELGLLRAGPRDVVELHMAVLKQRTAATHSQRAQAYVEEGRVIVLELMGDLASFYRAYTMGQRS